MSTQVHCDICDKALRKPDKVTATSSEDGVPERTMDLCRPHFNAYKRVVNEWTKLETGFVVSWPSRTPA